LCFALALAQPAGVSAQVATAIVPDSTLGTTVDSVGPRHEISGGTRPDAGPNLFHSFARFSIGTGDSAIFTSAEGVQNILARVTGDFGSEIDGELGVAAVEGADVFLFNPSGVILGPNAQLNTGGSFHAASASEIRFVDGTTFSGSGLEGDVLSTAAPAAFGFLGGGARPVEVEQAFLSVPDGESVTLAGGSVDIRASLLFAPGGLLSLAAVEGPGAVGLSGAASLDPLSADRGPITISGGTLIDVGGATGGRVRIVGGRVSVDGAAIFADSFGSTGEGVAIDAERIDIVNGTLISARAFGTDRGGGIEFTATDAVRIDQSFVSTASEGPGNAGAISVDADSLMLSGFSILNSDAFGTGVGGSIEFQLSGDMSMEDATTISVLGLFGPSGKISIQAANLTMADGAQINSDMFAVGAPGDIVIRVGGNLLLDRFSQISAASFAFDSQLAESGRVSIQANNVVIDNGSAILGSAAFFGRGADIDVTAHDTVVVRGSLFGESSEITSATLGFGTAGDLDIAARDVSILHGGRVTSRTEDTGTGGFLSIRAGSAVLIRGVSAEGTPSLISSESISGLPGAGDAGAVLVAAQHLVIDQGGEISTRAAISDGGDIKLNISGNILLDAGTISTSVASGAGTGGNIDIDPFSVILFQGRIQANAFGGPGGNIRIVTQNLFTDPGSVIEASSAQSVDGVIEIRAPDTDVSGALAVLPSDFVDAATQLATACAERGGQVTATLVAGGRGGLPVAPGGPMVSTFATAPSPALAGTRPGTVVAVHEGPHPLTEPLPSAKGKTAVHIAGSGFVPVNGMLECRA
jgi:filamentous hemagglutinin family protein